MIAVGHNSVRDYTVLSILSVVAVVAAELVWFKTGIFKTARFWIAYAIILFFECLVDGWLTKLSAPIVTYDPSEFSGWRFPFDIPVEDFLFGFSLIVLTILCWEKAGRNRAARDGRNGRGG